MVIEMVGVDGTSAFVSAEDVRIILPAQEDTPELPTKDKETGVAIVRPPTEIKASIVSWNTPGAEAIVIGEPPAALAKRVNEALRGAAYDIPAVTA